VDDRHMDDRHVDDRHVDECHVDERHVYGRHVDALPLTEDAPHPAEVGEAPVAMQPAKRNIRFRSGDIQSGLGNIQPGSGNTQPGLGNIQPGLGVLGVTSGGEGAVHPPHSRASDNAGGQALPALGADNDLAVPAVAMRLEEAFEALSVQVAFFHMQRMQVGASSVLFTLHNFIFYFYSSVLRALHNGNRGCVDPHGAPSI
jgi:hypothetical protein